MAETVQALVESLIRLEEIDKNLFRGSQLWTPDGARGVFGGQIIAQSLFAAARTRTESEKAMAPHSLHCYFLLPGSSESPALYTVRRVRDGRSFATRLVTTTQRGRPIFSSMVSFHSTKERTTLEHADAMPDAPDPETLPDASARLAAVLADERLPDHLRPLVEHMGAQQAPIDFRYCDPVDVFRPGAMPPTRRTWFRAAQPLPESEGGALVGPAPGCDGAVLHQCVIAYASDQPLLATALLPHGMTPMHTGMMASLDHSLWWHAPARADSWLLFETTAPRFVSGRALCFGHVWRRDGVLVASTAQEGLIRTKLLRRVADPTSKDEGERASRL